MARRPLSGMANQAVGSEHSGRPHLAGSTGGVVPGSPLEQYDFLIYSNGNTAVGQLCQVATSLPEGLWRHHHPSMHCYRLLTSELNSVLVHCKCPFCLKCHNQGAIKLHALLAG